MCMCFKHNRWHSNFDMCVNFLQANIALFEARCKEKIQQFEDAGSDEDDIWDEKDVTFAPEAQRRPRWVRHTCTKKLNFFFFFFCNWTELSYWINLNGLIILSFHLFLNYLLLNVFIKGAGLPSFDSIKQDYQVKHGHSCSAVRASWYGCEPCATRFWTTKTFKW